MAGIDIIGFPTGKFGIGDQTRSVARAAILGGYNVNLIDVSHPTDKIKNDDFELLDYVGKDFKHDIRIYTLTQNHIAALVYRHGTSFFDNAKNIFQLAWEFDRRPTDLDAGIRFSDEIWGISTFTSKAFENDYGIPVNTMHNAADVKIDPSLGRDFFDLPKNDFLFCFSFDFNSFMTRKNPEACIDAFMKAFPQTSGVGLVVKVSNADENTPAWKNLASKIEAFKNIYLINKVLSKIEVLSLFNSCDAYVSLHRSEGFGIGMAENMLLEKPVVCTGFSGNMDFCSSETAFLVDYKIVDVPMGAYPSSTGLQWADPSVESAAENMRSIFENRSESAKRALQGKKFVQENFSTRALADRFDQLIRKFELRM